VLALREVLEASEAQNEGHLSPSSVGGAATTALRLLNDDPGVGSNLQRSALVHALTADGSPETRSTLKDSSTTKSLMRCMISRQTTPRSGVGPLHQILRLLPSAHPERSPLISLT
jgi:hypothetical protein